MIILLMEFFYPPQLLTKFEGNGVCVCACVCVCVCVCRTGDTKSGPHFAHGL